MELRLTTVVVALAFIGLVSSVPTHRSNNHQNQQQNNQHNNQLHGQKSQEEIVQLLKQIDERVKYEITTEAPAKFTELVAGLKQLPHHVISSIDRQVRASGSFSSRKLEDIWNDALIMDASEGSLKLVTRQILEDSVSPARKNYLLTSMAFVERPSAGAVRAVLPLLEQQQVPRQALLGVSALIRNAQKHQNLPEKDVQDAVNAILKYLKRHESSPDKVTVALKALQNLQSISEALPTIAKLASDSNGKNSVRVSAMDALRSHAAHKFVQEKVMAIFNNKQESSEVRIAAYKVLVSHPDQTVIRRILSTLRSEDNKQVGAFVTSHLDNLKESSAPRHQEIRRILEGEEIPTSRFPSDIRKYSRNVELSRHTQTLGLGAVMDADLIYDRSIAPRSVRFNLSLPLNEREINIVELGIRQVGLESQIKNLFSQNGPLAGKNMPQILSEIAEFFQSDSTINEVARSRVMYHRSTHRQQAQQNEQASELEASMFLNLDGKTVAYLDLADLTNPENDMRIVVKSLKNHLRSGDWSELQDRAFALSFNREYEYPSKVGYKPVSVNGSVLFGIRADRTGFWPSMSLELSTQTPNKRVVQRVHSSPSLKFAVEAKKVTVSLPRDQMNILTVSSQAFDIDVAGVERAVAVSSKKLETCSSHLSKALGVELCARLSGPKKLLREEEPYFAPWNMEVTVTKTDSRMQGWEVTFELPAAGDRQPTYKFGFDTPRSSEKRNFAVQVQLLDEPTGLRAKIDLPNRQVEGAVAYRVNRDEVYGKVELALERDNKYSVEAGLKNKSTGKKSEWTPLLEIQQPRSQPITLTGSVAVETGRKNQLSFNIHNNAQNGKKFVKGSIVREGDIFSDMKLSTDLQAELDQITFKLYGMADKKESGSATTDIKVDYQLPNSRKHNAHFIGKIQNLSKDQTTKMNSFVELQMTQFPEKNVHIGWNIQHKPNEQMENELTIMWRDQMNDPRRKIHILQNSKFTGLRSGRTATSDNVVSIEIAPFQMKYEIKAFGHLERSNAPSYKLSFEVNDKMTNKNVAASWEYRHTSISPLKMSIDASLLYPGRQLRYSDKIEEVSANIFKGATQFQWAQEKKMTVEYVFKRRSESNSKIYELDADLKTPSMALQHSGMMRMSPRDIEFTTKMSKEQGKFWDVAAHWTKDDKSALRFEVTGVEGKMEVSPFAAQKSLVFEVSGKTFSHYSNLALSRDSMSVSSKTMKDKKPLFVVNSKMDQDIISGPHDVEVRFQGLKSKTGEQKVKIHHEIKNGQAKGTVTYYIKNQEKASFESYASAKATSAEAQITAGVTFKTQYKYHNLDGFHIGFDHRHQKSANNRVKSESTIRAHLGDEKARITVEAEKQGNFKAGQGTAKVTIETPVYDFKHQEAEFTAEWNNQKARVTMKGVNNQNKTVRASGEVENKNGRLFARMEGQSEIHRRNTEATLTADKHSIVLVAKSNEKEVIKAEAKANYNSPREFTASVQGKVMNSPMYHASTEARPTGKQVRYNVIAKRNEKTYASGQLSLDYSNGYDAELKMETEPQKVKLQLTSQVARDLVNGPHKIEVRVESDRLNQRTVRLSHSINNNQAKDNFAYLVGQSEKLAVDSAIYYLRQRESRATKHTSNMEVTVRMDGQSYSMKHSGALKVDRDAVEFDSKAHAQGKNAWEVDGVLSRSARSSLNFKVRDVNGKLEVTPFAPTKIAKVDIRSNHYSHESNMEVTPRSWALKATSKTMVNNKPVVTLDIVRVPEQPNRLNIESKWLDAKMEADMAKEPMTASFNYNGKTSDKTNLRASVSGSKNEFALHAEGQSKSMKKISTTLKGRRSNSHAEVDVTVDQNGRERFASHARYETQEGYRGQVSLKKDGKDLASTRVSINQRPTNGPNEIEIIFGSDESYKANHESNNGKWTVSLTHSKAGSRKDFAELAGQLRMTGNSADMSIELNTEFARKHANIKSANLKMTHRHDMSNNRFSSQTTAKASINKSSYESSVQATYEPSSKMTLEMSAQTPLNGLEKQQANIEVNWSRDSANLQARAQSAAGYLVKVQGNANLDKERSVSAKVHVETPRRNFERQEAEVTAQWSKANAKVTIAVSDAKARKIRVTGESDISQDSILARGQVDSEFPQIKSSLIEVRGDRQSALLLVKSNNEELIRAEGKGKWSNWNEFNGELKGKSRSSPQLVLTLSANKIGEQTKYQAVAKRDTETVAMVEATREQGENRKHSLEVQLPLMKTRASIKSDVSRSAAHGPHQLQVEFEHPKFGKRNAQITHKITPDGTIKCSVLYTKDGQTKFNIEHSGTYRVEVRAGEKKLYMDAEFEAKICKKTFKMRHNGNLRLTRNSVDFESKAELDRKTAWNTKGSFSRSDKSHLMIEAGEYQGELRLSPFEQDKSIKVDIKSPHGTHKSEGHFNVRSHELRVVSKTQRKSQQVVDFEIERRPNGIAKINVESMWADYRVEYDISKRPMTASMTLTTKKYKPAIDMKVQASGDENTIELSGEYKSSNSYAGSLRVRRSNEEVQVEFDSKKNQKPLYSGRAVAARKADGIKANARIAQKDSDVAQVTLTLSNRALAGPHEIEIQIPQKSQSIRMRHEILAGQLKATATHMVNGAKKSTVEVTGKATGHLENADITLTFNGETQGKKIMNIGSLQVSLNHKHSINAHGFELASQLKGFINRKDNLQVKIASSLDTRSRAVASVEVQTPFNEYKKQELEIESNWAPKSMEVQGKFVNSAGQSIRVKGNTSLRAARLVVKGNLKSEMRSIPSINVDGSADSQGFFLNVDKNEQRAFQVEGKVNSAQWSKVDAQIKGKLNRGPMYSASLKGTYEKPEASYEFVTREGEQELMAARANAQINGSHDWNTAFQLTAMGSEMASFDLKKEQSKAGHRSYVASYSSLNVEPREHRIHEADVEPLFRSIRKSIRGF